MIGQYGTAVAQLPYGVYIAEQRQLALSGEPLGGEKDELDEDEDEEESLLLGAILRSLNKLV